ncbi:hypothetical protein VTO73DRAFT_5263 [Trametes versicolor]
MAVRMAAGAFDPGRGVRASIGIAESTDFGVPMPICAAHNSPSSAVRPWALDFASRRPTVSTGPTCCAYAVVHTAGTLESLNILNRPGNLPLPRSP